MPFGVDELRRALSEELQSSTILAFSVLEDESTGLSASASVTLLEDKVICVNLSNRGYSYSVSRHPHLHEQLSLRQALV